MSAQRAGLTQALALNATRSQVTLEDLENDRWGKPTFPSHLVTECHRLRKVPIEQFTAENLRIMIGQGFSLPHLMPLALAKLLEDPFVGGDFYPGDLLQMVLQTKWKFWEEHPDLFGQLQDVMSALQARQTLVEEELLPAWQAYFR